MEIIYKRNSKFREQDDGNSPRNLNINFIDYDN